MSCMNIHLSNNILRWNSNRTLFLGWLSNQWFVHFASIFENDHSGSSFWTFFSKDFSNRSATVQGRLIQFRLFESFGQWNHSEFDYLLYFCSLGRSKTMFAPIWCIFRTDYLRTLKPERLCFLPSTSISSSFCSKLWRKLYYWTILYATSLPKLENCNNYIYNNTNDYYR